MGARVIIELTAEDLEVIVWALGFTEGAALEIHDDETGKRPNAVAEKLKAQAIGGVVD
jgi:hypothetical protein